MNGRRIYGLGLLAVAAGIAGCGPGSEQIIQDEEDAISASTPAYVTLRHDQRRCIAPLCGGYWLHDLNRNRDDVYVSGLDFSEVDEATSALILETPEADLIVRGVLGAREARYRTRPLRVLAGWRGLVDVARADGDRFYSVAANDPPIECFAAPCNNDVSTLLNRGTERHFTGLVANEALGAVVESSWVADQAEHRGALVAGHFEDGVRYSAGAESLLVTSQVYVVLEAPAPLPRCTHVRCSAGFHCVNEGEQTCVADETWTPEAVSVVSASPYRNGEHSEWIYTSETANADAVRIHFSAFDLESGWDFVIILDPSGTELARYTGSLGDFTTDAFVGSEVRIVFTTDESVTRPGFTIDRVDSRTH